MSQLKPPVLFNYNAAKEGIEVSLRESIMETKEYLFTRLTEEFGVAIDKKVLLDTPSEVQKGEVYRFSLPSKCISLQIDVNKNGKLDFELHSVEPNTSWRRLFNADLADFPVLTKAPDTSITIAQLDDVLKDISDLMKK